MTRSYTRLMAVAVALLMAMCVAVSADTVVLSSTDTITGAGGIQSVTCNAVVTKGLDNIFTYTYELVFETGDATIHTYIVQNPNNVNFFDAANVPASGASAFLNPADGDSDWLQWANGNIHQGGICTFSYKSAYAPMFDIKGWQITINGGSSAVGRTIVMGDTIPEPGSALVLLMGVAGLVPMAIRRRRK